MRGKESQGKWCAAVEKSVGINLGAEANSILVLNKYKVTRESACIVGKIHYSVSERS